jgi:hypothetical protein
VVELACQVCEERFEAKRSTAKYCSERCKKRAQRGAGAKNAETREQETRSGLGSVAAATLIELQEAKRLQTPLGQAALALAHRLDMSQMDTGQAVASLAKQLQQTLEAATADAQLENDPVDEVRAARERKLRAVAG